MGASITQVKLADGRVVDLVDWSHCPLYSTADFRTGFTQTEVSLFQYTEGGVVPGISATATPTRRTATQQDTNITTIGAMASSEEMLVYGIRAMYSAFRLTTTNNFTTAGLLVLGLPVPKPETLQNFFAQTIGWLEISQKRVHQATMGWYNTGFGVSGQGMYLGGTAQTGTAGRAMATAGLPSCEAVCALAVPAHIGSTEKYRFVISNPSGAACQLSFAEDDNQGSDSAEDMLRVTVFLDGLYKRPTA